VSKSFPSTSSARTLPDSLLRLVYAVDRHELVLPPRERQRLRVASNPNVVLSLVGQVEMTARLLRSDYEPDVIRALASTAPKQNPQHDPYRHVLHALLLDSVGRQFPAKVSEGLAMGLLRNLERFPWAVQMARIRAVHAVSQVGFPQGTQDRITALVERWETATAPPHWMAWKLAAADQVRLALRGRRREWPPFMSDGSPMQMKALRLWIC
jgi:hypothetical protein